MVLIYKVYRFKSGKKSRFGYECFACGTFCRRKRDLYAHQGDLWPGCPELTSKLPIDEISNSEIIK